MTRILRSIVARLALALLAPATLAHAADDGKVAVVASFSILADLVRNVGGDGVRVTALVGPDADAHIYSPSPADARSLAAADLVVVNGLGFEGWIDRLVAASGYRGPIVVASAGVSPLQETATGPDGKQHTALDPHAWQNLANARIYVDNIARGLAAADPRRAANHAARARRYAASIEQLDASVRREFGAIPRAQRRVITSHDAFAYFGSAYDVEFIHLVGVSTESETSARDIAALTERIRRDRISAMFLENISSPRLLEQVAKESGARIGGTLYSDARSGPDGPASTYLDMFRHNVGQLVRALRGPER